MSFTSLSFVFLILPIFVIAYGFLVRRHSGAGKIFLIAASLLFYAWGDIRSLPLLLLSVLFHYFSGRELMRLAGEGQDGQTILHRRISLAVTLGVDLALLGIFKYTSLSMPVGISFYTFSALSYIFDIYYGRTEADNRLVNVAVYILFFPKLISGPIIQYKDMVGQLDSLAVRRTDLAYGGYLFVVGLFKKVLLADRLGAVFALIHAEPRLSAGTAWLGMIFYSLQLYFDFSGYSDMAIGLARIFGIRIEKNFHYPYLSDGCGEFWRRWHISLGAWFRDYVYIPLGGSRVSRSRHMVNLMAVWILTGIWHGNTWNFLAWGIYHGLFVLADKYLILPVRDRIPRPVRILATTLIVWIGWVIFFSDSLGGAIHYLGQMAGLGGLGLVDGAAIYYFMGNLLLLAVSLFLCGPFLKNLHDGIVFHGGRTERMVSTLLHVMLLIVCLANMVGATYTTFLYFKF